MPVGATAGGALALVPQRGHGGAHSSKAKALQQTQLNALDEQFCNSLAKHAKKNSPQLQTLVNIFSEAEAAGHVKGPRFGFHGITLKEFKHVLNMFRVRASVSDAAEILIAHGVNGRTLTADRFMKEFMPSNFSSADWASCRQQGVLLKQRARQSKGKKPGGESSHVVTQLPPSLRSTSWSLGQVEKSLQTKLEQHASKRSDQLRQILRMFEEAVSLGHRDNGRMGTYGLNVPEFKHLLNVLGLVCSDDEATALFKKYNSNNDGTLTCHDFVTNLMPPDYTMKTWHELREEELAKSRKHQDTSDEEHVLKALPASLAKSYWDLNTIEQKLQEKLEAHAAKRSDQFRKILLMFEASHNLGHRKDRSGSYGLNAKEFGILLNTLGLVVTEADCKALLSRYDMSGDGVLTVYEFVKACMPKDYSEETWHESRRKEMEKEALRKKEEGKNNISAHAATALPSSLKSNKFSWSLDQMEAALIQKLEAHASRQSDQFRQILKLFERSGYVLGHGAVNKDNQNQTGAEAEQFAGHRTNKALNASEFQKLLNLMGIIATPAEAQQLLNKYDTDHDGNLSVYELVKSLMPKDYADDYRAPVDSSQSESFTFEFSTSSAATGNSGRATRGMAKAREGIETLKPRDLKLVLSSLREKLESRGKRAKYHLQRMCKRYDKSSPETPNGQISAKGWKKILQQFNLSVSRSELRKIESSFGVFSEKASDNTAGQLLALKYVDLVNAIFKVPKTPESTSLYTPDTSKAGTIYWAGVPVPEEKSSELLQPTTGDTNVLTPQTVEEKENTDTTLVPKPQPAPILFEGDPNDMSNIPGVRQAQSWSPSKWPSRETFFTEREEMDKAGGFSAILGLKPPTASSVQQASEELADTQKRYKLYLKRKEAQGGLNSTSIQSPINSEKHNSGQPSLVPLSPFPPTTGTRPQNERARTAGGAGSGRTLIEPQSANLSGRYPMAATARSPNHHGQSEYNTVRPGSKSSRPGSAKHTPRRLDLAASLAAAARRPAAKQHSPNIWRQPFVSSSPFKSAFTSSSPIRSSQGKLVPLPPVNRAS